MTNTKRTNKILSCILCLAMVLTILPMSVFAVDEMAVPVQVTVTEDGYIEYDGTGDYPDGVYADPVPNGLSFTLDPNREYVFSGDALISDLSNFGTILSGDFSGIVSNRHYEDFTGTISGGTFNSIVYNYGGNITSGTFNSIVYNYGGNITGGTFSAGILNYDGNVASGMKYANVGNLEFEIQNLGTGSITVKQNSVDIPLTNGKAGEVYNVANFDSDTLVGLYMLREGETIPAENFSIDENVFTPFYFLGTLTHYDFTMPDEAVTIAAVFNDYEYVEPIGISIYPMIIEGTDPEQLENGDMLYDYELSRFTDFSEEIMLPGEYIDNTITIDNNIYELAGFINYSYDEETDTETYSLAETYTIAPEPADKESDEWFEWFTPISDGIYAAYILANDTHEHYAEGENEWNADITQHWKICADCGSPFDRGFHSFIQPRSFCTICGYDCEHSRTTIENDEVYHWDYCNLCRNRISDQTRHTDGNSDKICDCCDFDMSEWYYFGFSNSREDFFVAGEKRNYAINDYEDDFIEWASERYSYPGWRNDVQMILDLQYSNWGGSCYGYAVVECLYNLGLMDFNDYYQGAHSITDFPAPAKMSDKDIRSLLNYYWLTQFLTVCQTQSYYLNGILGMMGRSEMLEFADYIVNGQNKAMFSYYFIENGYTCGHAFVVDGGVKNDDGSYILNAYDNRFHGYKWVDDGTDVLIQVVVAQDGTAKVYSPGGRATKDGDSVTLYEFEEVIDIFEYSRADEASFAAFKSLLPWDEDMLDIFVTWVYAPKVVLLPVNAQGTANIKVSTDEFEVCVNDFAEGNPEPDAIGEFYLISGGLSSVSGDGVVNENTPAGIMFELNGVADSYEIASPAGTISLSTENGLTTLNTDGAASAEFDTVSGAVSVDNNTGDFSVTVTTSDGTIARVSGTANGDITVTPKESTVELDAPNGTYAVEYTKADDTVTEDTIRIGSTSTGGSGGGTSRYTIKFDTDGGTQIANKTVTRNSKLAEPEDPTKDGYSFIGWYTDEELTEKYDFNKAVTKGFTLYAKWDKHDDEQTSAFENPFTDVDTSDWFYEDVKYAVENGLFNGTTNTTFAPDGIITRAMMVTVLYRAEGEPEMKNAQWFEDVAKEQWYSDAVAWATFNGITMGYGNGNFGPDDYITREQIAAIMHRYAQYKGYDVSVGENTNILSYDDFADISEYAIASMQYAVGSGLMKGKTESTLNPLDNATRAEIAAILHRFMKGNTDTMAPILLYQGHGNVRIETPEGKVIYVDPYAGEGYDLPADLILVTHGHSDHNKLDLIEKQNDDCTVITHEESNLDGVHQSFDLGYVKIEAVEAENKNHNINECVGYILTFSNGKKVYFSGDTSTTNQMSELAEKKIDYAFYCCDGKFNMDREEASKCAELVGATYNIPYHMAPGSNFDRSIAEEFDAPGRIILEDGQTLEIK